MRFSLFFCSSTSATGEVGIFCSRAGFSPKSMFIERAKPMAMLGIIIKSPLSGLGQSLAGMGLFVNRRQQYPYLVKFDKSFIHRFCRKFVDKEYGCFSLK